MVDMSDRVDHDALYRVAESQAGYFTTRQAKEAGMSPTTLRHHAMPGRRYDRVRTGLYRLRHFPASPHEHVVAAWLPLRHAGAVVSHVSALELYGLSDLMPRTIHLSLPRSERGQRPRPGVELHTVTSPSALDDRLTVKGMSATSPERAIVESFLHAEQPEQIEMAIRQALRRGLTTPKRLRDVAEAASKRASVFVESVLGDRQLRFEEARRMLLPLAEAQGILTDEDVFEIVS